VTAGQYARHSHLCIRHDDLKPWITVFDSRQERDSQAAGILDIAKLMASRTAGPLVMPTAVTGVGQRLLTPDYAISESPEQFLGQTLSTGKRPSTRSRVCAV
jgi:hypothetical protein